jgi:hypothetical protein
VLSSKDGVDTRQTWLFAASVITYISKEGQNSRMGEKQWLSREQL